MRKALFASGLLLCFSLNADAQQANVNSFTAPLAGTVILSEVEDKYHAQVVSLEAPSPDGNLDKMKLRAVKQASAARFPRKASSAHQKTTLAPPPVLTGHYVADSLPGIPPDNYLAVSKGNKSVSVVNSTIAIHDAQNGTMLNRKGLKQFSSSVALNKITDRRYDPKIIYDPNEDKFICVMLNSTDADNWIVVGFSQSNDPLGAWNFYKFYGDYLSDTTWFDYPAIAITQNEFFLTGNKIRFNASWQLGFSETVIYQINKHQGYSGASNLNYTTWEKTSHNGTRIRNLHPVKGGAAVYGPEQYFLSNRNFDIINDTIFLVKVPTEQSTPGTLTVTPLICPIAYGVPPSGRQPDTSVTLSTNDARVLGAFREGNEIHFVSTTIDTNNGNAAILHGMITDFDTNPVITANIFSIDTLDFGYPNISFSGIHNGKNTAIISFNYTGPNTNPGMGAIFFDGTQYSEMLDVKQGVNSISQLPGKDQRWGDYMGSQPDWNHIGAVWIEGIFGRADEDYGNYIARLRSPYATAVSDLASRKLSVTAYPNPAFTYISLEFSLEDDKSLNFKIFDLQGRLVDHLTSHYCKKGHNRLRFNTEPLVPGTYFIKAVDEQGQLACSLRFVKH